MQRFDKVIKGGTIFDGMQTPRFVSDIGIVDGRVAYIGPIKDPGTAEVIDAQGLHVAPGFIDTHTHYDSQIFWDPYVTMSGWHGVTSIIIGNCGFGFAPCHPDQRERAMLTMSRNEAVPMVTMKAGMPWDWETFPEFLDSLERTPKGVNVMAYVPIAPLMVYVMGMEAAKTRAATAAERQRLRTLFNQSMDAGACGFSIQFTGAWNIQRDFDGTPMVTDVMSKDDLLLFAEILRDRGEGYIQATCNPEIAEELAGVSGRPVIWNILGITGDQHGGRIPPHRTVLDWASAANARGNRIFTQTICTTSEAQFTMEDWNLFDQNVIWREVTLGTVAEKKQKMSDPSRREVLRQDHDRRKGRVSDRLESVVNTKPSDDEDSEFVITLPTPTLSSFRIAECQLEENKKYDGLTVGEYAVAVKKHPIDAFLDLAVQEGLKTQFEHQSLCPLSHPAFGEILRAPNSLPGVSDGGAHTKFITIGRFTTEFLAEHIRKYNVMSLEEAHWRLSGYPAYAGGIKDRGVLREGAPADIIVYDYKALKVLPVEIAHDYPANEWRRVQRAEGYRYILVNGGITFKDGKSTGATPGRLLRHGFDTSSKKQAIAA